MMKHWSTVRCQVIILGGDPVLGEWINRSRPIPPGPDSLVWTLILSDNPGLGYLRAPGANRLSLRLHVRPSTDRWELVFIYRIWNITLSKVGKLTNLYFIFKTKVITISMHTCLYICFWIGYDIARQHTNAKSYWMYKRWVIFCACFWYSKQIRYNSVVQKKHLLHQICHVLA